MFYKNPKIVIIGAGRIAGSLLKGLVNANYNIQSVISKNIKSAENYSKRFFIDQFSDDFSTITKDSNVFLLTVPDNQIKTVADQLEKSDINFSESLFVHFSGALSSSVVDNLKNKGAQTASFHIMQSFPTKDFVNLESLTAAIETNFIEAEKFLFALAEKLNLKPFKLFEKDKVNYHIAGVYASNYFVGNLLSVSKILKENKTEYPDFDKLILPIVSTTLQNVKSNGLENSLSGPIERGELDVIKKHITELRKMDNENFIIEGKNIFLLNYICQSLSLLMNLKDKSTNLNDNQEKLYNFLVDEFHSFIK